MGTYILVVVEESANRVGFYDPDTHEELGNVSTSLWPHEISIASDGLAYVSNFGVRDYDLSLGYAGNSVSIIDTANRCEVGRMFTQSDSNRYWGPHGVKVSPDERYLFVNVERVVGVREPDLYRPGIEYTKLLKFDRQTGLCVGVLSIPMPSYAPSTRLLSKFSDVAVAYDVLPGTHNFVFSPTNPNELWLFSGRSGVSIMDVNSGAIIHQMGGLNGAVRALAFGASGQLLVSATNQVSLVDPTTRTITAQFGNLGVGQLLYSKLTPDEKYILAPAVWEGMLLVIDAQSGNVLHRLSTGVDPVQVVISPDLERAYVTHGRSLWLAYIQLKQLDRIAGRIPTKGGPNGMSFAPSTKSRKSGTVTFGACLPFTGRYASVGREMRLGYQHWQDTINQSGGLRIGDVACRVEIVYSNTASSIEESEVRAIAKDLINQHRPLAMFGTFPGSTDRWIGDETNVAKTPYLSPLGNDPGLFDGKHPYVFGLTASRRCSLESVLMAIRQRVSPKPKTVVVLAADDPDHRKEATCVVETAISLGFELLVPSDATDDGMLTHAIDGNNISESIVFARDLAPDLFCIVSDQANSITIVEACESIGFRPGGLALSCGITTAGFKDRIGAVRANGLLGGVAWTTNVALFAEDRFGSSEDYARVYFDTYSEPASFYAALSSATGICLEQVIHSGCDATPGDLIERLRKLDFTSFVGPIRFDANGRNEAHAALGIQLFAQSGTARELSLWPLGFAGNRRPSWPRP